MQCTPERSVPGNHRHLFHFKCSAVLCCWGVAYCCCFAFRPLFIAFIPIEDEQMETKRNLRVSAAATVLSLVSLVLAVVAVVSPYWGRFSNDGSPNSGGKYYYFHHFSLWRDDGGDTMRGRKWGPSAICRVKVRRGKVLFLLSSS